MTEGSVLPAIGMPWRREGGLWVPHPPRAPIDYTSVYMVLDDYVPGISMEHADHVREEIVGAYRREDLLLALAALVHIDADAELSSRLRGHFARALRPEFAARMLVATDPRGREPRRLLSRQGVLTAMKASLSAAPDANGTRPVPLAVAAVLLVHACSMLLGRRARGERDDLMMELVRNIDFNQQRGTAVHIIDHIELWEAFGDEAVEYGGVPATDLVHRFTGLGVRDFVAFAFAVGRRAIAYEPGQPLVVGADLPGVNRSHEDVAAFLDAVSATPEQLAARYAGERDGPWNFVPFQRTPVLRLHGDRVAVLDLRMLFDRVTDGIYWDVHDGLRAEEGNRSRAAWTRAYGAMVEAFVRSRFPSLAPAGLDGPTYYSEDACKRAYPRSKVCDGVIDMGSLFLTVEVVSGRLTLDSRVHGDVAAFRRDTEKVVLKKARQLDAASKALLRDESALTGRPAVIGRRVQPILVAGGGFPVEPISNAYVREEAERGGFFLDARVGSPAIVTLDELSMLVGLAERGTSPDQLVAEWQGSGLHSMSLYNFLIQRFPGLHDRFRPSRSEWAWDELEDDLLRRLGLSAPARA